MSDYTNLLEPRLERIQEQAGFFRRGLAFVLDILIIDFFITSPFAPLFTNLVARVEASGAWSLAYTTQEYLTLILMFFVIYAYFVLFEYLLGQTIGMMLLGTKKAGGESAWQPVVRNCFLLPFFPFVLLWIVEPLAIIFFKRSVLEYLSGTRTVHQREVVF